MKKLFTLLFALTFVFATGLIAQNPTVEIGDETGTSPVDVPVTIDPDDAIIAAFDLTITYDNSLITNVEIFGATFTPLPDITINGGQFLVAWDGLGTSTLIDTETITLRFTGNAIGSSALDFTGINVGGQTELIEEAGGQITSTIFTNGSVEFDALPIPIKNWALYIGMGMILVFAAFRFIRIL